MLKALVRDRLLVLLLLLVFFLRLFSLNNSWVEHVYSLGLYSTIAATLRIVFGWLPLSVGDLLYFLLIIWFCKKVWQLLVLYRRKKWREQYTWPWFRKYAKRVLLIYLIFSLFWGLNYYRQGIPAQLSISIAPYSNEDIFRVTGVLAQRLNACAVEIDSVQRLQYNQQRFLFAKGIAAYRNVQRQHPFLAYNHPAIKASLFTPVGKFVGFTGYYNPFTAEAQLKTDIPVFLKPFVVTHEIAHQLGYAKENEASFVAYLTCKASPDVNFRYSTYFELYRDAMGACRQTGDTAWTDSLSRTMHRRVQNDIHELRQYLIRNRNFIEPFMTALYDRYLKLNNQPKGKATYDEVIAYLIAYVKKFGVEAI